MRVLLVEDDRAMAESIEMMLKSEGFVIDSTDLGEDAPLLLKTRAFLFLQDDPRYLALLRRVGFTAAP